MHKRVSRAVIHISWYALVTVIVTSALLISLIWIASSKIDDLRPTILEWVESSTGQPVEVEKLAIEWQGVIPKLKLSTIDVLDKNSHKTLTHFSQAMLSVDLYHSLINWQVTIARLELSGLNVELLHKDDGTISLLELTEQPTGSNDGLSQWLLQQPHLQINNSKIIWHEKVKQPKPLSLTNVELKLKNRSKKRLHQLTGSANLEFNKGAVDFVIDVTGDPLSHIWDATALLNTQEFDLINYIPTESFNKLEATLQKENIVLNNARLSSNVQIKLEDAKVSHLNGHFSLKDAETTYSMDSDFQLDVSDDKGWTLVFPDISVTTLERRWQAFSLEAEIPSDFSMQQPEVDIEMKNIRIEDFITVVPTKQFEQLDSFRVKGELENLNIQYNQKKSKAPILVKGNFTGLESSAYNKMPGLKNLSGNFQAQSDQINLNLDSYDLELERMTNTGELEEPVFFDKLSGDLEWKYNEQGWLLSIPQITLVDPDLEFQMTGTVRKDVASSPELDLHGTFFRGNAEPIVKMIPSNILHPKINKWLDEAIVSGQLTGGTVVFRGAIDQFPFEENQGFFEVRLNAENGVLNYFKGWPRIEQINAEVVFTEKNMFITAPYSVIDGIPVKNTTVEIPELKTKAHRLLINGNAKGRVKDAIHFINNSLLKSSIGKQLSNLNFSGPLDLNLHLEIPLSKGKEVKVKGKVKLQKNSLAIDSLGVQIKALNGEFIFTRNRWFAKNLKARLYESAININLDVDRSKTNGRSNIRLSGLADKNYITNRMLQVGMTREQLNVLKSVNGTTTWHAKLSLPANIGAPDEETGLVITSNLKGLSILAPTPLGKAKNTEQPLKISTTLSKKPNQQVTFQFGDVVKGKIKTRSKQNSSGLERIDLHFGNGKLPKSTKDNYMIKAGGKISRLDLSAWSSFIAKHFKEGVKSKPSEDLISFNLHIGELLSAGQVFKNNHILGISSKNTWELQLENNRANGMLSIPYNLSEQALKADFERLTLTSSDSQSNVESFNSKDLPEIFLSSQQFQYNDLNLGSLQMHAKPLAEGSSIEKIVISSPNTTINISGKWLIQNKQQSSKFKIHASAESLGAMLKEFGFGSSGIAEGKTDIDIDASWKGSPADFQLAKLNGSLVLNVGSGRLVEVQNRVGKVFGLLSIQSIGRRLSLDFNDLFKEGFSFDEITGDFKIDKGNAYTNNLNMLGPSANIDIAGRVGLAKQDYDQIIRVTPAITDSLPVAGVLFGPVGAGVGAAIYLAEKVVPIIPNTIDKVLAIQYTLRGSWQEPLVEPLVVAKKGGEGVRGFDSL